MKSYLDDTFKTQHKRILMQLRSTWNHELIEKYRSYLW